MKLITSPTRLEAEFTRLIREHDSLQWATAWAGTSSKPFEALLAAQDKIKRMVVGLHFYQTHPDFIQAFLDHKSVRFIKQPQGTFHPKVYLFYDDAGSWEMLVGSGNFTSQAFTVNTEAAVLVSHADDNAAAMLKSVLASIDVCWKNGAPFTQSELDAYRTTWTNQKPKVKSLSGQYGSKQTAQKPIYEVPVATMTWKQFIGAVRNDRFHSMSRRLAVVELAREWFTAYDHFKDMTGDQRKFVAGLPNALKTEGVDSNWFGSMKGSGVFSSRIGANDGDISRALDQIPLSGQLTRTHFDGFVREYQKALDGNFVATATRLLAMKRPDVFVCLDSRNKTELCKAFEIPQAGMDYDRYWDEIVERIGDSEWWLHPQPTGKEEVRVSEARAAFLDSLYYRERE